MIRSFAIATTATTLLWCSDVVGAFQLSHRSSFCSVADGIQHSSTMKEEQTNQNRKTLLSMNGKNNDNEYKGDFDLFEDDEQNDKGDELAQQFYQQLRAREEQKKNLKNQKQSKDDNDDDKKDDNVPKDSIPHKGPKTEQSKLSEDELRKRNRKAFLKRKEISVSRQQRRDGGNDDSKSSSISPSPSVEAIRFFSASKGVTGSGAQQGNSLFSESSSSFNDRNNNRGGNNNNARQNMIQQEFNLLRIASSETAILIQIALVVLLLIFELSIGMNGGITDGSDRFGDEPNEFNGVGYDDENTILLQQQKEDEKVEEILKNMSPSSGSVGGGSVWL